MLSRTLAIASHMLAPANNYLRRYSPVTVIASVLFFLKVYNLYRNVNNTTDKKKKLINSGVKALMWAPVIGDKIRNTAEKKLTETFSEIKMSVDKARSQWQPIESLPRTGLRNKDILKRFDSLQANYHEGRVSGAVYTKYEAELQKLLENVWGKTALTNPLHTEWPLIHLMKAEIISMCQNMLHGKSGAHGILTHGGTTSIIEACMAYVIYAREKGIETPEIIVPGTAHVAFDKAAELLHARLVKIPVDPVTGKANVSAMEKAINGNTCLMVGSAPSYPYGIIDPITELAAAAKRNNIPFHVDNCLGGGITVFARLAGFDIPPCDFSVPGVTSISFDTHKYLQTPKGTSVLLFHPSCPATPTLTYLDWIGGMYVTDDLDGSRSGADIATTWTVLCYKGETSYIDDTRKILMLQRNLVEKLRRIYGVQIAHDPQLSVIGIRTEEGINPLLVAQKLKEKNWSVNILQKIVEEKTLQLFAVPQVDGFHFCLTSVHANWPGFADAFTNDLKDAVEYARLNPNEKPKGMFKAYGALEEGIPSFIQKRIGDGYAKIQNAIPGKEIPGIWKPQVLDQSHPDYLIPKNTR